MKKKDCHGQKHCYRNIEDKNTYIDFWVIGVNYWTKKRSISNISKHGKNTDIIMFHSYFVYGLLTENCYEL